MKRSILIVNYNTPELIEAAIASVRKHTPGCEFTVFDNSDSRPFWGMEGVAVFDNTRGQLIDFEAMLDHYPKKRPTVCRWGSEKHIASVDYMFDFLRDGFVLMDSDALVKRDISDLFDTRYGWAGSIEYKPDFWFKAARCYPFLLWINVPLLRTKCIRFFHEGMVYKMSHHGPPYYDTGGSLYFDCNERGLPYKEINIFDYIEHLGGASCRSTDWRAWLDKNKELYE